MDGHGQIVPLISAELLNRTLRAKCLCVSVPAPLNPERPFNWGGPAAIIILVAFFGFYLKLVLYWFICPFKGFPMESGFCPPQERRIKVF